MKTTAWKQLQNFLKDEEGATAVEYGVMIALIIAVAIVAIGPLGETVRDTFSGVDTVIAPAAAPAG